MAEKRLFKVLKLEILKPAGEMSWRELSKLLRAVRYRVFRLANMFMSEQYLAYQLRRAGRNDLFEKRKVSALNNELRRILQTDAPSENDLPRLARKGALPDSILGALSQYRLRPLATGEKWKEVTDGRAALPSFRSNMAIPIRCDKPGDRRLERMPNGDVEVDLRICLHPYPRVVLKTRKLDGGAAAVLDRLLANEKQSPDGYRQRYFELQWHERKRQWTLNVAYNFPAEKPLHLSTDRIVGVDLGFACPAYVALSNGHARLGWNHFAGLAARVRRLQRHTLARRRNMQRAGKSALSKSTARSAHGRKRKLQSTERLRGRIADAYTTLNHQISDSVVQFALDHGAGAIQIEDLSSLKEKLAGTFLGARWRYFQLQQFIAYKAQERGIELRKVNAQYTSRRCSKCGRINKDFTRQFRDKNRREGFLTKFKCADPNCDFEADPDYNAARNLATPGIERKIKKECSGQGIPMPGRDDD